jgi:hypothetical protein
LLTSGAWLPPEPGSKILSNAWSVFSLVSLSTRLSTVRSAALSAFLANFLKNWALIEEPTISVTTKLMKVLLEVFIIVYFSFGF